MEKSQMFEKNPKKGMNLIFLNLLEFYDKNHNIHIESLKSSKHEVSCNVQKINHQISFGKNALEETINFYICEFQKQIKKINKVSQEINGPEDFEAFLQLDVSGENVKLLELNKFIQEQTLLIEKIKSSACFQKLGFKFEDQPITSVNAFSDFQTQSKGNKQRSFEFSACKREIANLYAIQGKTLNYFDDEEKKGYNYRSKNEEEKKEECKVNCKGALGSPASRYKKKFPSFTHKQGKYINKNLCEFEFKSASAYANNNNNNPSEMNCKNNNRSVLDNDNIFNTEIIRNIEEFGKNMNKECKLLKQKKFRDDSHLDFPQQNCNKKKTFEEKEKARSNYKAFQEDLKNRIKNLSESSKSVTVF